MLDSPEKRSPDLYWSPVLLISHVLTENPNCAPWGERSDLVHLSSTHCQRLGACSLHTSPTAQPSPISIISMLPSRSGYQEVAHPNPRVIGRDWHQVGGGQEDEQTGCDSSCHTASQLTSQHSNTEQILRVPCFRGKAR